MKDFVPGTQLAAAFYDEVIEPAVRPWPHSAARIGPGSDVLGYDTDRSTDHGWGPAVAIFVDPGQVAAVRHALEAALPHAFRGWPIRYELGDGTVGDNVKVTTLRAWLEARLGCDPSTSEPALEDWLLIPQQALLELTGGAVFADATGDLARVRSRMSRYPDDVWVWLIACQWRRIAQEEAFVGRTAEVGDELGSRLVTARLARELMRLWFLFERTYWPYAKWFGTAFSRLPGSGPLHKALDAAVTALDHPEREAGLVAAYELVARRHNELAITEPVDPTVRTYYERPFRVLMSDRIVDACVAVLSPRLAALPLVGSVDQVADSTDLLSHGARPRLLRALYETA